MDIEHYSTQPTNWSSVCLIKFRAYSTRFCWITHTSYSPRNGPCLLDACSFAQVFNNPRLKVRTKCIIISNDCEVKTDPFVRATVQVGTLVLSRMMEFSILNEQQPLWILFREYPLLRSWNYHVTIFMLNFFRFVAKKCMQEYRPFSNPN